MVIPQALNRSGREKMINSESPTHILQEAIRCNILVVKTTVERTTQPRKWEGAYLLTKTRIWARTEPAGTSLLTATDLSVPTNPTRTSLFMKGHIGARANLTRSNPHWR